MSVSISQPTFSSPELLEHTSGIVAQPWGFGKRWTDSDLWEAETRLLLGQVDGAEALEIEAMIAKHRAADCN